MAAKLYTDATKAMKALNMIETQGSSAEKISIEMVCKKNILTYGDLRKIVEVDKNTMPLIDTGSRSVYKPNDPNLIDDLNMKIDTLNSNYVDSDPIHLRKGVIIKVTAKVIKDLVKVMTAHSGSSDAIRKILDSIGETAPKADNKAKIAEAKAKVKELKKIATDANKAYENAQKAYEKAQKAYEKAAGS
jgi:vacuolar-type H+-ATPase subunit I/STV1